jgi:hypothetical protein
MSRESPDMDDLYGVGAEAADAFAGHCDEVWESILKALPQNTEFDSGDGDDEGARDSMIEEARQLFEKAMTAVWTQYRTASGQAESAAEEIERLRALARHDAEAVCPQCKGRKIVGQTKVSDGVTCPTCSGTGQRPSPSPAEPALETEKCDTCEHERLLSPAKRPSPSASEAYGLEQNHRMFCIRANFLKRPAQCICDQGGEAERPARQDELVRALQIEIEQIDGDYVRLTPKLANDIIAALRSQPVVPLSVARPQPSQGRWAIFYHDVDVHPETFVGDNAEVAARKRYVQARDHWECYLLREVADEPSASQGEAVSEELRAAVRYAITLMTTSDLMDLCAEGAGHQFTEIAQRHIELRKKHAATLSTWAESK